MKLTEAWENRDAVLNACRGQGACWSEFSKLVQADIQTDFEQILCRNFTWCVDCGVLEDWLPACTKETL